MLKDLTQFIRTLSQLSQKASTIFFANLDAIRISFTTITSISFADFSSWSNLIYFDASYNKIETLVGNFFSNFFKASNHQFLRQLNSKGWSKFIVKFERVEESWFSIQSLHKRSCCNTRSNRKLENWVDHAVSNSRNINNKHIINDYWFRSMLTKMYK